MASNMFDSADAAAIIQRIHALDPLSPARWGTMDICQMLDHCSTQLQMALGMIPPGGPEGPFIMRTWLGRQAGLYIFPWLKKLPTPSKMNMAHREVPPAAFEPARQQLLDLLAQVRDSADLEPHPFFGVLNRKAWGRLIWKHLDHHLKQFGQ